MWLCPSTEGKRIQCVAGENACPSKDVGGPQAYFDLLAAVRDPSHEGHRSMLVAQDDGHSVSTMERTYAAWITGAKPEDIERIKAAMAGQPLTDNVGEGCTIGGHSNIPRQVTTV